MLAVYAYFTLTNPRADAVPVAAYTGGEDADRLTLAIINQAHGGEPDALLWERILIYAYSASRYLLKKLFRADKHQ